MAGISYLREYNTEMGKGGLTGDGLLGSWSFFLVGSIHGRIGFFGLFLDFRYSDSCATVFAAN